MSFVNLKSAAKITDLKGAHYAFPRADRLWEGMEYTITDYYSKAALSRPFEARGLLLTGPSRIGKSTEIRKILDLVNDGSTLMPDGRPARIVSVVLAGTLTWKDLGLHTLREGLGYPAVGRITQRDVWERVQFQAKEQGVVGIHYDECQHIFARSTGEAKDKILDSFKSLLKQPEWPLMLVLSGVDSLAQVIGSAEQLAYLLRPITFGEINLHRDADRNEIHTLCHAYAEKAGLDLSELAGMDFYTRLDVACSSRWGLVIELLIDALLIALDEENQKLSSRHFCSAFTRRMGLRDGFSPFSVPDHEALFQSQKILEIWERMGGTENA